MNALWSFIQNWYHRIINSIAFLPALLAILCLLLAFAMITVEYEPFAIDLKQRISYLLITNREEARLVLGTLVASIISLMVFSFSMVMVVLSMASTNLSPRVLPGLISNKTHQFILGLYLGTIIYTLILITNFQTDGDHHIPSLGILIAMILGIACLWLFIYFIHSISQNIQVENILEGILRKTQKVLRKKNEQDAKPEEVQPDESWLPIYSDESGYLVKCNTSALLSIACKHDLQISVTRNAAFFFVKGYPFLRIKGKPPLKSETVKAIKRCFLFGLTDQLSEHYLHGFNQISEIAVKALSPGINDPGTAMKALDHLSLLLIERICMPEFPVVRDDDGCIRILHAPVTFEELLFRNLVQIREFGKSDVLVQLRILSVMKNLIICAREKPDHIETIVSFIVSCSESTDENIRNLWDREEINKAFRTINKHLPTRFYLKPLSIKN